MRLISAHGFAFTDVSQMRTPSIPHSPMSVAHSLTTVSDPSVSTMDLSNSNDDAASSQPLVNEQTTAPLRTFRGWKRYAVHFERSRSPRGSGHSQVAMLTHELLIASAPSAFSQQGVLIQSPILS